MNGILGTIGIQKMLIDLSWDPQLSKHEEGDVVNEKQSTWGEMVMSFKLLPFHQLPHSKIRKV